MREQVRVWGDGKGQLLWRHNVNKVYAEDDQMIHFGNSFIDIEADNFWDQNDDVIIRKEQKSD